MSPRTILTLANGCGFDLLNPTPSDIDWNAFAEQLAKEARFNGATPGVFYSVAEHSVRCADAALTDTGNELLAAYLLIHDTKEGGLKDDTTPKKRALAEMAETEFGVLAPTIMDAYAALEDRHDVAIHAAAGLSWPPSPDMQIGIKHYDLALFVTEWRDLMRGIEHPCWEPYEKVEPLPRRIVPWEWGTARSLFLNRCTRLLPALKVEKIA